MKKFLVYAAISAASMITPLAISAQVTIELPYSRNVEISNGQWGKWSPKWESEKAINGFVPNVTVKKSDDEVYKVTFYYGGSSSGMAEETVVYDPTETGRIRKSNSDNSLNAYRYTGTSKDFIWTQGFSLKDLAKSKSAWTSKPNARLYTINPSLGSGTMYAGAMPSKRFSTNFVANRQKVKGTWDNWSSWNPVPRNSYFELQMISENSKYIFKYYENDKLIKNYEITYSDAMTKEIRKNNDKAYAYSIDGFKNGYIYLLNTAMSAVLKNPEKWSKENDAVIVILDDEKTGKRTRIK